MGPLMEAHRRYLKKRGFPKDITETWELQGTRGLSGASWNWRVIFPVYDNGKVASYGGRAISEKHKPKFRMTEDEKCRVDPRTLVYGDHRVQGNSVVIVEGVTDVWNMGPGAIAPMGIGWRMEQIEKLRSYERRFVMFDPERTAQQRARKLAEVLSVFPGSTEIITGLETDPGGLSLREVKRIRKELEV